MDDLEQLASHANEAAELLKQLGNTHRLMICCLLIDDEMSVGELNARIPLSQSALSQHLAKMREAGLVKTRKEQQTVYYALDGQASIAVIRTLKSIYCPE